MGAKRARQTRESAGLDAVSPLECVLTLAERDLGIPVVIASLRDGIAGYCWRDGGRVLLWVNGHDLAARQRFTLAHELGHVRCGHDGTIRPETFVTLSGRTTDSREVQANAFAAELLAPAEAVRAMVDGGEPTLEEVVRIAATFGISTIAALFRLNSLGLTGRGDRLRGEIDDGEHRAVWERLGLEPKADDVIAAVAEDGPPRLSPALHGSALAAALGL